jgi:hypothetical protein
MDIPFIIVQQISAFNPFIWDTIISNNYRIMVENNKRQGGLIFDFNQGSKIASGSVAVELGWNDEYVVIIYDSNGIARKRIESVYFPELANLIEDNL